MVFVVIVCDKRRHGPIFCLIGSARLLIDKWLDVNIATLDTLGRNSAANTDLQPTPRTFCEQTGDICGDICTLCTATGHAHVRLRRSTVHKPAQSTTHMLHGGLSSCTWSRPGHGDGEQSQAWADYGAERWTLVVTVMSHDGVRCEGGIFSG